ncbi:MAG: NUDIX hydrolase [Gammaproteobacteria bacterium]|nr:NUDIX hydrolase [Gammaproteobacteria bacterium]
MTTKIKPEKKPHINRWQPHVTVAAIIKHENKFLFVEELINGQKFINQPAGHLEKNESFVEAVSRETLEETGWHFVPQFLIGIYRWVHPHTQETFLRHCFTGEATHQEQNYQLDKGILRTLWLDKNELKQHPSELRSPLVSQCIDDFETGVRYPIDLYRA